MLAQFPVCSGNGMCISGNVVRDKLTFLYGFSTLFVYFSLIGLLASSTVLYLIDQEVRLPIMNVCFCVPWEEVLVLLSKELVYSTQ